VRAGAWRASTSAGSSPVTVALNGLAEVRAELSAEPVQMSGRWHAGPRGGRRLRAPLMNPASAEASAATDPCGALAVRRHRDRPVLFRFEWSHRIELEWATPPPAAAARAAPGARIAVEHALSSESFDAYTDTRDAAPVSRMPVVPPDGRPVVVFNRPVRDLGQVGSPSVPGSPAAEAVGPAAFSYRLGHVVLVRTDGGDRVVAAAGVAHVGAAGVVTLPGAPSCGARVAHVAGRASPVAVTAVAVSRVARPRHGGPECRAPYRLGGPRPAAAT